MQGRAIGWGDEGDGQWYPLMLPWVPDDPFTNEKLLEVLGAHPVLQQNARSRPLLEEDVEPEDDPTGPFTLALAAFLAEHEETLVFHAGSDQLNPVPCFAVARVRPDLVAGFVGGVVHT